MSRFTQTIPNIRTSLLHGAMIGAWVAALTMLPTDARAHGWSFSNGELAAGVLIVAAEIASGVVLISDGIDLLDEPKPTAWNAGWDIALAVPNAAICVVGWMNLNPQDGGAIVGTVTTCVVSTLLVSHGIWELSLLDERDSRDDSSQESATFSVGPTVLDNEGSWGFGVAGSF